MYQLDTTHRIGQSTKLRPIYTGPFLVVEVLTSVLYRIEGRRRTKVVHHDRIRVCNDRKVPLWIRRRRNAFLSDAAKETGEPSDETRLPEPESQPEPLPDEIDLSSLFQEPKEKVKRPEPITLPQKTIQPSRTTRAGRDVKPPTWLQDYGR